jgi:hypothetical protein
MEEKQIRQKSAWVVWVFMILYAATLALISVVSFQLPLEGATSALLLVVSGYVGVDQMASIVTSMKMPSGLKYTGSYKKLLKILVGMFIIVGEAIVVQGLSPDTQLPLDQLVFATGLVAALFVSGNKANTAAEKTGKKK